MRHILHNVLVIRHVKTQSLAFGAKFSSQAFYTHTSGEHGSSLDNIMIEHTILQSKGMCLWVIASRFPIDFRKMVYIYSVFLQLEPSLEILLTLSLCKFYYCNHPQVVWPIYYV